MIKNTIKTAFFAFLVAIVPCLSIKTTYYADAVEQEIQIDAKAAYMVDYASGTEIISQNADAKLPIASMTKLATLAVIFDEIDSGRISLDKKISISQNAAKTEGSSAFLDAGSFYSVEDLIKTIVIVSANDSCVALAEELSGSEELFAKRMNAYAQKLGLTNTNFENSTGLPSPSHYSSAKDMAKIYMQICNNEIYKKYSKIWMEDFIHPSGRKTGLVNTNRLIKTYNGCDSGKTGHTDEAKYCLTASASRMQTRFVAVVIGAPTSKTRFAEITKMFNYGFANFQSRNIVNTEIPLTKVNLSNSRTKELNIFAASAYNVFEKKGEETKYSTRYQLPDIVKAPIHAEQKIGTLLVLNQNNVVVEEIDLVAREKVEAIKFSEILDNIYKNW